MKRLMRRPWVQALLGWLLWVVLVITRRSVRWRHDNVACAAEALKDDAPCIVLFWHGRIPLALGIAQVWWVRNKLRCMISPSSDGEFIAQALSRARFPAIRMSSAKAGDKEKMRAAVAGMREAIGWVKGGGLLAITPDGLALRGWFRSQVLQRSAIKIIRITEFRRYARTVRMLEIETVDGGMVFLSRWDLGTNPLNVLDALTAAGYAGHNRR